MYFLVEQQAFRGKHVFYFEGLVSWTGWKSFQVISVWGLSGSPAAGSVDPEQKHKQLSVVTQSRLPTGRSDSHTDSSDTNRWNNLIYQMNTGRFINKNWFQYLPLNLDLLKLQMSDVKFLVIWFLKSCICSHFNKKVGKYCNRTQRWHCFVAERQTF